MAGARPSRAADRTGLVEGVHAPPPLPRGRADDQPQRRTSPGRRLKRPKRFARSSPSSANALPVETLDAARGDPHNCHRNRGGRVWHTGRRNPFYINCLNRKGPLGTRGRCRGPRRQAAALYAIDDELEATRGDRHGARPARGIPAARRPTSGGRLTPGRRRAAATTGERSSNASGIGGGGRGGEPAATVRSVSVSGTAPACDRGAGADTLPGGKNSPGATRARWV